MICLDLERSPGFDAVDPPAPEERSEEGERGVAHTNTDPQNPHCYQPALQVRPGWGMLDTYAFNVADAFL